MWADKYRPVSVKDMCAPTHANELLQWLQGWSPTSEKKAALLSGPPGVGKTTSVHLVAKELGATVIEYNASDFRSKKSLKENVSTMVQNSVFGANKVILLMDEVDGCDIGGVGEVINMIKTTKVPILCTCNDKWHQKLRSLLNHVLEINFKRPRCDIVANYICNRVLAVENVSLSKDLLRDIIQQEGGDIRSILTNLQVWTLQSSRMGNQQLSAAAKISQKNRTMGIFGAAELFLLGREKHLFEELQSAFYGEDLVDLFVQENYIHFSPEKDNPSRFFQGVCRAAAEISEGDKISAMIFQTQAWSMSPAHMLFSSVLPSAYVRGYYNTFLSGPAAGFDRSRPVKFPAWLGNNSTAGKNKRLAAVVTKAATDPVKGISGNSVDLMLDYIPLGLYLALMTPLATATPTTPASPGTPLPQLTAAEKTSIVEGVIGTMDNYGLLRDDWDFIVGSSQFKCSTMPDKSRAVRTIIQARENATRCNFLGSGALSGGVVPATSTLMIPRLDAQIPTALKSHLTREFNKTHKKDSATRVAGAVASQSMKAATETQEDGEEEAETQEDAVVAAAKAAAVAAKKPPAKASRSTKAKTAPGPDDGTKKPAGKRGKAAGVKRPNDEIIVDDEPL